MDTMLTDQQKLTFIICVDTGCSREELPWVMAERDEWQEKVEGVGLKPICSYLCEQLVFIRFYSYSYYY